MPSAGIEPAIPAAKRFQTYNFYVMATGIGSLNVYRNKKCVYRKFRSRLIIRCVACKVLCPSYSFNR